MKEKDDLNGSGYLSIEDFCRLGNLSIRTRNCFRRNNIKDLGDLLEHSEQSLLATPNYGKRSLKEVKRLLASMCLKLKNEEVEVKEKRIKIINEIEEYANSGYDFDQIQLLSGLSQANLRDLYRKFGGQVNSSYKQLKYKAGINLVKRKLWNEGGLTFNRLRQETNLGIKALGKIGTEEIEIDSEKIQIKEFLYDDFVLYGVTMGKIGELMGGLTRERGRQYVNHTGQYQKWEEGKEKSIIKKGEEKVKLKEKKKDLLELIVRKSLSDSREDWALNTTTRVHLMKRKYHESIDFDKLRHLYQIYDDYKDKDEEDQPGLEKMAEMTGLGWASNVKRQLEWAGLKAFGKHSGKIPRRMSEKELERIEFSLETNFSNKAVGYFTNIPHYIISQHHSQSEKKNRRLYLGSVTKHNIFHFSYKVASEIYEALDSGIPKKEIIGGIGLTPKTLKKYRKKRKAISKEIISGLEMIYPEFAGKIDKPYLTEEIKELQSQEKQENYVVNKIKDALAQGAESRRKIRELTGYCRDTVDKYAEIAGIELPKAKGGRPSIN